MASLVGQQLKDTYDSLLKTSDNDALGGTYKEITDGSGNGSNLYLGTGGRVGIGETSPSSALTVKSDEGALFSDASGTRFIDIIPPKTGNSFVGEIGTRSSHNLVFNTVDTERMRITNGGDISFRDTSNNEAFYWDASAGSLGIGTTSPADSGSQYGDLTINGTDGAFLHLQSNGSTTGVLQTIGTETRLSTAVSSGYLAFRTDDGTAGTEAMRIDSSGNLLVGTTSDDPAFDRENGTCLDPNGSILVRATTAWNLGSNVTAPTHISFYTDNGSARVTAGNISSSGSTTSFNTSSDYRIKENVVPMVGALDKVAQLKPSEFNFIGEETTMGGFLAHEVQEIIPNAVTGKKDAVDEEGNPIYQGIDHSKLVPILVGAIQELRAEIEQLKNQ